MNDSNKEQPGKPPLPQTPVARKSRWHFASSIVLMSLGAIGIIVYLVGPKFAEKYEGVGAALCVVACGGFLVWHVIHLLAEEDQIQDELLKADKWPGSSREENPDVQQTNLTKPPPEAGPNVE